VPNFQERALNLSAFPIAVPVTAAVSAAIGAMRLHLDDVCLER